MTDIVATIELEGSIELQASIEAENPSTADAVINDGIDGGGPGSTYPTPTGSALLIQLQVRRGIESLWNSVNPVLRSGEIGLVSDQKYLVVGNGVDAFVDLIVDKDNVYETKGYIDFWVDSIFANYDGAIGAILSNISTLESNIITVSSDLVAEALIRETADTGLQTQINNIVNWKVSKYLASDVITTLATLSNASHGSDPKNNLGFSIGANEIWEFEISGTLLPATNVGARIAVDIPAGAYLGGYLFGSVNTNAAFRTLPLQTAGGEISNTMWSGTGVEGLFLIKGCIFNGSTAGDVQFKFRTFTAGNSLTMKKGSHLKAERQL